MFAQPGRLHPDPDVGALGKRPTRARGLQPGCHRSSHNRRHAQEPVHHAKPRSNAPRLRGSGVPTCPTPARLQRAAGKGPRHRSRERRASTAQFEKLAEAQDRVLDLSNWHEYLKCLQAAGYRSRKMISSENALLFSYALWLVGRTDFGLDLPTLRTVIARWFFMAHTTGRYTSSPESALEFDLSRLAALPTGDGAAFIAELDRIAPLRTSPATTGRSRSRTTSTPQHLDRRCCSPTSRRSTSSTRRCSSAMCESESARPGRDAPRAIERHHLFPKAYLARGETGGRRRRTRSRTWLSRLVRERQDQSIDPAEYLSVMAAGIPADRLTRQIEHHALPMGWEQLDYQTFLEKRRLLIARVVRDAFATLSRRRRGGRRNRRRPHLRRGVGHR